MTIKNRLTEKAHIFAAVLLIIQPLLDNISFWFEKFGLSGNITLALRLAVLAVTVLYGFIISDRKGMYWIAFGIIAFLYAGHLFAIWQAGIVSIVADFANFVRVVQMPLCAICLITCVRANKGGFEAIQRGITVALIIILAVMIISTVTGTDPHTYKDGSGILGWFNNTNSQSSNLCVLLPIALAWQLTWKKRNPLLIILTCVLGLLAMYFFCTRLAYLGIIAVTFGLGVVILIIRRTDWKYSIFFLALGILFVGLIPVSPMTEHLNMYNGEQAQRQEWLNDKIEDPEEVKLLLNKKNNNNKKVTGSGSEAADENPNKLSEAEQQTLVHQLKPVYETYIPDFVQIFGLEETMEMYNYTTDVTKFAAIRPKKLMFAKLLMNESPISSRVFGLEISRFTQQTVDANGNKVTTIYDVENDFHGVYYLYGWAGLISYLAFVAYFLYLVAWALIKNIKKYFTLEAASFGIALILCLAHAYNTAGVLRRPNASIFLSATLAGIYYLVKVKEYEDIPKIPKITDVFKKR